LSLGLNLIIEMNFSYFGLSATQEHLYKHFAVSGDQVHETRFVISLAGLLDSDHLFASLRDLIARHEGLRTKFILHNGQVLQGVCNDDIYLNPEIIDVDNTGLISNYETDGHIDLDDFPLFKVNLYRRNDTQHFLVFRCHEILLDRESCSIILYDLTCLYGGLGLKATDLQYVDYSIQQSDMLKSDAGQFTRNYWQAALSHLGRSEFPFDSKVECGSLDRKSLTFLVNKSDIDLTICDAETEYLYFFLAVYFIFIHKNSTDTDIIVSLYSPERGIDFSDVVGNFSNIVPVRRQISPSVRFKEFYDEIKIAVH
jgi:hypothetical protein